MTPAQRRALARKIQEDENKKAANKMQKEVVNESNKAADEQKLKDNQKVEKTEEQKKRDAAKEKKEKEERQAEFVKLAKKHLAPAIKMVKDFAGDNAETLLAMSPIGKFLGLSKPEKSKMTCSEPGSISGCCCSGGDGPGSAAQISSEDLDDDRVGADQMAQLLNMKDQGFSDDQIAQELLMQINSQDSDSAY